MISAPTSMTPDWNPEQVVADIVTALKLAPAQARDLSARWTTLPIDRIGELRRIKNTTAPLERLLRHLPPGPIRDQAQEWLAIRHLLP